MRDRLCPLLLRLHILPALNGRLEDRVLDGARIRAGDKVVDVGEGVGLLTAAIVELVGPDGDVLAIDISVDSLEELRANTTAPNVSYFIGRVDVLPLMDESVDVVVAHSVDAVAEAAHELFRVLSSGGRTSISGEGELGPVLTGAGFSDVRTESACLTGTKP